MKITEVDGTCPKCKLPRKFQIDFETGPNPLPLVFREHPFTVVCPECAYAFRSIGRISPDNRYDVVNDPHDDAYYDREPQEVPDWALKGKNPPSALQSEAKPHTSSDLLADTAIHGECGHTTEYHESTMKCWNCKTIMTLRVPTIRTFSKKMECPICGVKPMDEKEHEHERKNQKPTGRNPSIPGEWSPCF